MGTAAGAGGDVHRVLYDAVALCSASCAEMTTTKPTMKGAATPVTVRLEQAPPPHLTRRKFNIFTRKFFYSAPQDFVMLGVFYLLRALSSSGG